MMTYPVMIPDAKIDQPYTYRFKDGRTGTVVLHEYGGRYPSQTEVNEVLTLQLEDMVARTREHLRAEAPEGSIEFGQDGLYQLSSGVENGQHYQEFRMVIGFG